ncbi:MAG: DUF1577 domain-containing protein [Leptospiraceae bacterium]|nr:DUF1577 domain-containing protein [Leptospiraceae bacterium]
MDFIERKKREMDEVNDVPRRHALFSRFLMNTEFYVKDLKKAQYLAKMTDYSKDCSEITLQIQEGNFLEGTKIFISKFVGRFVQIEGVTIEKWSNSTFKIKIEKILFAKKSRGKNRIFPPKDVVYANNFKMNRASMELDNLNIPAFVKITFDDFKKRLINSYDFIDINVFHHGMDDKFFLVKHSGKSFYVRNTQDKNSYQTDNVEEFLNCEEEFLDDIGDMIREFKNDKVASELIMPVLYVNSSVEVSNIGYVHIQNKKKFIEFEDFLDIKLMTLDMVDRIRESNTLVYTEKAEIINFSLDGLKVRVSDSDLQQQIKAINGFTLDIVFKKQTPINVSVLVRNIVKDEIGDLLVGLEIDGFRKGDKERYIHNLQVLTRPSRN